MPLSDSDLSALATEVSAELGIVGAQVAVLTEGRLFEGATGLANLQTGVPVTPDTLFQVGSTTKVHTAALVMQLVADGRIGLDVPVVDQLPGFALADDTSTRTVTPRHLMSMSSGIDNGPYTDYGRGDDAVARYVAALPEVPCQFAPGAGFGYSNASTNISGRLVEHVTGQTWDDVLRERLLEPAGLHNSATGAEDVIWRRFALGHTVDEAGTPSVLRHWSLPRSMGPAGGTLSSTASDLVRLGHLFLADGRALDGTTVLPLDATKSMQEHVATVPPTLLAEWWGLGPYGKVWDGVEVMGHSGTNIAGSSYLLWAPERNIAIATTVNVPGLGYPFAARMFATLFHEIAGITVPSAVTAATAPKAVDVDPEPLVGRYAMSGTTFTVAADSEGLTAAISGNALDGAEMPPSRLVPLTPTTFLPTDPRIDGRRGWAVAFLGTEHGPATHLVNGFFALRRVAA